jgi:hypothetical protein
MLQCFNNLLFHVHRVNHAAKIKYNCPCLPNFKSKYWVLREVLTSPCNTQNAASKLSEKPELTSVVLNCLKQEMKITNFLLPTYIQFIMTCWFERAFDIWLLCHHNTAVIEWIIYTVYLKTRINQCCFELFETGNENHQLLTTNLPPVYHDMLICKGLWYMIMSS